MQFLNLRSALLALVTLAALIASGCSSMSVEECQALDWRTVGYEDGVVGASGNRIGQHRKACGKHGVTPNLAEYQAGREQGLREFCRPANGFRIGARGVGYSGVCPTDLDEEFSIAYQSGRQLNTLRSRVNNTSAAIASRRQEMVRLEDRMAQMAVEVLDPTLSHEQRVQLLLDTKNMAERKGAISTEIPQLLADLDVYQRDLEDYRSTLAYVE